MSTGVKSAGGLQRGIPPSVGYADISPTWGESGRTRSACLTNSASMTGRQVGPTPLSPLVGEMSGRTEGGSTTTQGNQIGSHSLRRREKTG